MKKKITLAMAAMIVVMAAGMQKANAQGWTLNGNSNVTDTSKLGSKNNKPVRIFTYNIERMRIDTGGRVGIGNTVPIAPLSFSSAGGQKITFGGTSSSNYGLGISTSLLQLHTDASSSDIAFGYGSSTSFTEKMRIKGNGLVGIGTSTPSATLHVNKSTLGEMLRISSSSSAYASIYEGTAYRGYWGSYSGNAEDVDFGTGSGNVTGKVHLAIQGAARFTIDASGNAGIGTTAPSAKLHVAGNAKINGANTLEFGADLTKEVNAGKIGYGAFTAGGLDIVGAGTTIATRKIKFWNEGGAEFTGNVMVGTSTAATGYRLSVGGKIMCEELKVLLRASWPDYVFSNDYKLMNLTELDTYIKTNNHLPGIKPAAEMEKEGLELGEMQRLMMQKIEELTLYVIELKKENEELKTMIVPAAK